MHKKGDIGEDGRMFVQYLKGAKNGEYWVTTERFSKMFPDYHERKERYAAYLKEMADTKEERAERDRLKHLERLKAKRKTNGEEIRRKDREWSAKKRLDPAWVAGRKEIAERYKAKQRAESAPRIAERARIKAEKEAAILKAREERLARIAENKARREREKASKPVRVLQTEEQRKEAERERKRQYKHRRRAKLRGMEVRVTPKQIRLARAKSKGVCHYCRNTFKSLTIDHVTALANGGTHTLDNIVFACHGCNSEKRDLPAHEFVKKFGRLIA